ncbi:MAG TPA: DUF2795 domain-containing protein [Deltaproteobacteria bacterium]|nr:DUF2795 domain-containing protein [Deltaproteobacteria bacterium]
MERLFLKRKEERAMANPGSAAEVEKYLKGIDYPASKKDLIDKARSNGAPEEICDILDGLPGNNFKSPIDVMKAFGKSH